MAIIPRGNQTPGMNVSSPVPIAGTGSARIQGEAIAQFGGAVSQFADQQLQFDRRLSYEEGANDVTNIAKEGEKFARDNSKPDGSDYQEKYIEYVQPKMDTAINARAGNDPRLVKQLTSYKDRVQVDMATSNTIKSLELREKYNFERTETQQNESANRLRANPSPNSVAAELSLNNRLIDDLAKPDAKGQSIISAQNAIALKKAYYEKSAKAMIAGLAEKEQYGQALNLLQATQSVDEQGKPMTVGVDPDKAVTLGYIDSREAAQLKGQGKMYEVPALTKGDKVKLSNEQALIMSGLDPREKAHLIDVMKAKVKEKTEVKLSDLNASVSGFEAISYSGATVDEREVANLKKQVNGNSNLSPIAKLRTMDRINTAYAINQQLQLASVTPRSQASNIIAGGAAKIQASADQAATFDPKMGTIGQDFAVQANRMQAQQALNTALQSIQTQQDKDPVAFFLTTDLSLRNQYLGTKDASTNPDGIKSLQSFMTTLLNKQQYIGIPIDKQKVLTVQESTQLANMLTSIPDAANTNAELNRMQATYGEHFPRVLNELAKVNKSLADYKGIAYADPHTREALVDAIKNEAAIMAEYTGPSAANDKKVINKSVDTQVKSSMAPFRLATLGTANDSGRLEVVQSLEKLVSLQAKRDMLRDGSLSSDDAVAKAYNDVIASTYDIVDTAKSSLLVPRIVGRRPMDIGIVKDYVDVYSKAGNFKELNVAIPAAYGDDSIKYGQVLQANARWVTNQTQTGIKLMQPTESGNLMSVYDKFGNPIEKSYEEINLKPGQKVIDQNKTLTQKLFGG
jgi:hypothetical protein